MHTVTYRYTVPLLRRYYLRELWSTQAGLLIALPLMAAVLIWAGFDPGYRWMAAVLGGFVIAYAMMIYATLRQAKKHVINEPITATFSETGLHFDSAWVVSDLPWSTIISARATPEGLILTGRGALQPVLIPAESLSPQVIDFVLRMTKRGSTERQDGA